MKLIKMLDPEPSIRIHPKFVYSGFNLIGLYEHEDGGTVKRVVEFVPKKMHHRNTSKYSPHQGEQEKKRRLARGIHV